MRKLIIIVFVLVLIQTSQAQTTLFPFCENTSGNDFFVHLLLSDGDTTYVSDITGQPAWFAADITNDVFYLYTDTDSRLEKRSLTDGSLLANHAFIPQYCLFVDGDELLWTINETDSSKIRKWNSDLTLNTTYTIKSGILNDDNIQHMCLTQDAQYAYVIVDEASNECLAKISIDNLNGGSEEWAVDVASGTPFFCCVDDSDNVYLSCATGTIVIKYYSDGTLAWEYDCDYGTAYSLRFYENPSNRVIISTMNDSNDDKYASMINAVTGNLIGRTAALDDGLMNLCIVDTCVYIGANTASGNRYIHKVGIYTDWSSRAYVTRYDIQASSEFMFLGDPSGDIGGALSPVSSASAKNVIIIR